MKRDKKGKSTAISFVLDKVTNNVWIIIPSIILIGFGGILTLVANFKFNLEFDGEKFTNILFGSIPTLIVAWFVACRDARDRQIKRNEELRKLRDIFISFIDEEIKRLVPPSCIRRETLYLGEGASLDDYISEILRIKEELRKFFDSRDWNLLRNLKLKEKISSSLSCAFDKIPVSIPSKPQNFSILGSAMTEKLSQSILLAGYSSYSLNQIFDAAISGYPKEPSYIPGIRKQFDDLFIEIGNLILQEINFS